MFLLLCCYTRMKMYRMFLTTDGAGCSVQPVRRLLEGGGLLPRGDLGPARGQSAVEQAGRHAR